MNNLYNHIINWIGLTNHNELFASIIKVAIALIISFVIFFILNKLILFLIRYFIKKSKTRWDNVLYNSKFFSKIILVIPAILFKIFITNIEWDDLWIIDRLSSIWIVISVILTITAFLDGIDKIYTTYEVSKNRPITVFVQILKIIFYTITAITLASIILNKSPEKLLYGLGAFTAVLMLIFKDTILGFVAGVQLISNRMIAIGDWIEIPNGDANGNVLEINLYTVKVQNWDMTISTVPTYLLMSQSFINWKGMQLSGGRRIKRSINIDISSVHFLEQYEIDNFKKSFFLDDYIKNMVSSLSGYTSAGEINYLDTEHLTNLGMFRIYLLSWLKSNESINGNMTMMVRQLQPTAIGLPLEIYCFSKITEWTAYESVQSDLFDHILSVAPYFNIKIFQYPMTFLNQDITTALNPAATAFSNSSMTAKK